MVSPDTDDLLARTAAGDVAARSQLLVRHQKRLRRMVACRLDRHLSARVDPSDVVQEVLAEANRRLAEYLKKRPLPFYPWLRQLAWDRLVALHRRHLHAQRRTVRLEEVLPLPDESAMQLANRLFAPGSSPSGRLRRRELREYIQTLLAQLGEHDREVLVLRHLEQLSVAEIAAVLGISEGAVKTRHVRALQRLRALLDEE